MTQVWQDALITTAPAPPGWLKIADGYIRAADVQPYEPLPDHAAMHGLCVVNAPSAAVRAWAAADAPLVGRIGHGGAAIIIDRLSAVDGDYVALDDGTSAVLGWSLAAAWVHHEADALPWITQVQLDPAAGRLHAWAGSTRVGTFAARIGAAFPAGWHPVSHKTAARHTSEQLGIPWTLWVDSHADQPCIYGVTWHNEFSRPSLSAAVELPSPAARWLYAHIADGTVIVNE
jgi:hypothetical protein